MEALVSQLEALTQKSPVLMIFEDAHWGDPTSLEVFGRIIDRVRSLRVLLIVTFRPEFQAPWTGRHYVTPITINRLGERDIEAMIDRVVGNKLIPAGVRQDIIERTDGIPLFVEEMTKSVLEAGTDEEAQRTAAAIPSTAPSVPASLHASLMARLDRLGPAKEIAQIGSAIGREFSLVLISAVMPKPERELNAALDRLVEAGLLFRQGIPPHTTYLFKHALVQDAAYGTLLRERRRALHARIAETLESQFAEIAETQSELLARHCTEAGLIEKAAGLWGKAGQRSLERSALVEAAEQFSRALDQIATLPSTPELRREEIKLQVALITPLYNIKGFAAAETKAATERARLLIEQAEAQGESLEDPLLLFAVLFGIFVANFVAFNGEVLPELAAQFLTLAERQGATGPLWQGHCMMGNSFTATGDLIQGRVHYDQGIALCDVATNRPLVTRFAAQDGRVGLLSFRSLTLWMLGYPQAALADVKDAIEDARKIGQATTLMLALFWGCLTEMSCRNYAEANSLNNQLLTVADQQGSPTFNVNGIVHKGCVLALTGQAAEGIQMLTSGLTASRSMGSTLCNPFYLSSLARAHAVLGKFDDAWRCIGEAETLIEQSKQRWFEAEVNRTAGEIALLLPKPRAAKAEAYFELALAVAQAQQAKSWELRAAMSMARLWRDQGKRDEARELLAPVYGWFTEGFDTLDLKDAKALLGELS